MRRLAALLVVGALAAQVRHHTGRPVAEAVEPGQLTSAEVESVVRGAAASVDGNGLAVVVKIYAMFRRVHHSFSRAQKAFSVSL